MYLSALFTISSIVKKVKKSKKFKKIKKAIKLLFPGKSIDEKSARFWLQMNNWNLDQAVTSCLDNGVTGNLSPISEHGKNDEQKIAGTNNCRKVLLKVFTDNDFNDISFVVEGEKIAANRVIMAGNSDYFKSLLMGSFRESTESEIKIVGVSSKTFHLIIQFCYLGHIKMNSLTEEELEELLLAAHQYQLTLLVESIVRYLEKIISVGNCFQWLDVASFIDLQQLKKVSLVAINQWLRETNQHENKVKATIDAKDETDTVSNPSMANLISCYDQLLKLKSETLVDLFKSSDFCFAHQLFLDYLLSNLDTSRILLTTLVNAKAFHFHQMSQKFLIKLLSINAKARVNPLSVNTFDFSAVEEDIIEALQKHADRAKDANVFDNSIYEISRDDFKTIAITSRHSKTIRSQISDIWYYFGKKCKSENYIEIELNSTFKVVRIEMDYEMSIIQLYTCLRHEYILNVLTSRDSEVWDTVYNAQNIDNLNFVSEDCGMKIFRSTKCLAIRLPEYKHSKYLRFQVIPLNLLQGKSCDWRSCRVKSLRLFAI